jgi:hypothetical protein
LPFVQSNNPILESYLKLMYQLLTNICSSNTHLCPRLDIALHTSIKSVIIGSSTLFTFPIFHYHSTQI